MSRAVRCAAALAALIAAALAPAVADAKTVPGAVVDITFKGQSSGTQTLSLPGADADPDSGCPARPASTYTITAVARWNATYSGVLLSLRKATGALSSRKLPKSSGGLTGGTLQLSGSTPVYQSGCLTSQPVSFSSALAKAPGRDGKPLFERNVGSDIFFLAGGGKGGITGSPAGFTLPGSSASPDPVHELLPFYLPPDAEVLPKQRNGRALASDVGAAVQWNKMLGALGSLRRRRSIGFQAHGRYDKAFDNFGGFSAADGNGLVGDCFDAWDEYRDGSTACTESTRGDFTITVRRRKLSTIVVQ